MKSALLAIASAILTVPARTETGFLDKTIESDGETIKYVVYVPKDYTGETPYPFILFLHGAGEQGNDGKKQASVGLGPAIKLAEDKWKFIVLFPQKPSGRGGFPEHEKLILDMIEKTKTEYKLDEKRFYITGLSMGGGGTWSMICKHPSLFAAAAPICGWGNPADAPKIKDLPIWNFHGDKDNTVPLTSSQTMIDAVKAAGGNPKFTIFPGVGHNSWDKAYREEKLYDWFLEHSKK